MKGGRRRITQTELDQLIRRVVQTAQPDRIILFGSAARGAMGASSDIDLLVIKGGAFNRNQLLGEIYRGLRGFHVAVDVLLATPEEEVYPEDLCFNAQQAAEKAIKALLIAHGVRFPYVHDIG
jgi:predicted nucleotidyltransferase